ncbi:MAG: efflux RND transporter periplasmic adaptor subunit [Candidatus Pacebacteria bacterium]|nr:efflux RND transporter periplasmic adaptor subunit [Candidatus Paceibacterota bacterium]
MKNKIISFKQFIKKMAKKKRNWFFLVIILLVLAFVFLKPDNDIKNIVTEVAKPIDLSQTVLATGQVTSNTDLALSFKTSGIVSSIKVKVGDKVKEGQVLANLDHDSELASLTSAEGVLAGANARLKKVLEGTEVSLAKIALDSAKTDYENVKKTQETIVLNAYNNLLNSSLEAIPEDGDSDYVAPTISGTYRLGKEGIIKINSYYSSGGTSFNVSGLTTGTGLSNTIIAQPIGDSGLYITFPDNENIYVRDWIIEIPNKKASDYLTNLNAYELALKTQASVIAQAEALVSQRQAEYDIKYSSSKGSEVELAEADVLSASGQVAQARARYNDTEIKAPADGTITRIDIKLGELAQALNEVIVIEDVDNMYIESNINEANILGLTEGLPVEITFDSFGPEEVFEGIVASIDPSSTLISGVVNYKIKVSVPEVAYLRPGMTANMIIEVREKEGVIAVPSRAILTDKGGNKTIRVITDSKNKKYEEVPVVTGMTGDGGLVEILEGLSSGDEFVALIKN